MGSGFSSKMSDNEHPFPILWDTEILAVKHLPLEVIPQAIKRFDDDVEGLPAVVAEESFDVLKDKTTGPSLIENPCDVKKERTPGIEKSQSLSGNREGLAGESSDKTVELRKLVCSNGGDVSSVDGVFKVVVINISGVAIPFIRIDNLMP